MLKKKMMVGLMLSLSGTACTPANLAALGATSSTSGTKGGAHGLVQTSGCSVAAAKSGGTITCADNSSAFIPNGSPFILQDGNGNKVGDYLISAKELTVFDAASNAIISYDPQYGTASSAMLFYESFDCSGQPYVAMGGIINTGVQNSGVLYLVQSGTKTLTYNSIRYEGFGQPPVETNLPLNCGNAAFSPGSPRGIPATAVFLPAMSYPNSKMPVTIAVPASVVVNVGQ